MKTKSLLIVVATLLVASSAFADGLLIPTDPFGQLISARPNPSVATPQHPFGLLTADRPGERSFFIAPGVHHGNGVKYVGFVGGYTNTAVSSPFQISANYLRLSGAGFVDRYGVDAKVSHTFGLVTGAVVASIGHFSGVGLDTTVTAALDVPLGSHFLATANLGYSRFDPEGFDAVHDTVLGLGVAFQLPNTGLHIGGDYIFENDITADASYAGTVAYAAGNIGTFKVSIFQHSGWSAFYVKSFSLR